MAGKRSTTQMKARKAKSQIPIVYKHQPRWGVLVKQRIALARANSKIITTGNGAKGKSRDSIAKEIQGRKLMDLALKIKALECCSDEPFMKSARNLRRALPLRRLTQAVDPVVWTA
ncbi:MAG: hypothetical protein R6V84_10770 [Desulfobacterales bacterium]